MRNAKIIFLLSLFFVLMRAANAQNVPCRVNEKTLEFSGAAQAQAECLLRRVEPRGILGGDLQSLPKPLNKIIGARVKIKKEKLRRYLAARNISEESVGGSLDEKLSAAVLPGGKQVQAIYFLIHDTSTPNFLERNFPLDINEATWRGNDLNVWRNQPLAHIFVNRLGESVSPVKFSESLPDKKYGTKFARDVLKPAAKGLQIHVELVQPRRSDLNWFKGNDAIAPDIGFTDAQYQRLALLYVCAGVRRGKWLIPAFHAAVDAGIKDAHDDPQRFELAKFAAQIAGLLAALK